MLLFAFLEDQRSVANFLVYIWLDVELVSEVPVELKHVRQRLDQGPAFVINLAFYLKVELLLLAQIIMLNYVYLQMAFFVKKYVALGRCLLV